MRKIQISALVALVACVVFAAPSDDETALKVEEQVIANKKVLNHAARVFAKADLAVSPAIQELEKEIDSVLPQTAERIQEGRKSVFSLRSEVVQLDIAKPGGRYLLSDLYDGRRKTKAELTEFDQGVLAKKTDFDRQIAAAGSYAAKRALRSLWDEEWEKFKVQRGQIVARLRVYQDTIQARLKVLGKQAQTMDAQSDALENRLSALEDQFQSTENGLNAYRAKIHALYRTGGANGTPTPGTH